MDYFSLNAFILGSLMMLCMFISNILYALICIRLKVRILEFVIFFGGRFSLIRKKINDTTYILGSVPTGCFVRPLGLVDDDEEIKKISEADAPFSMHTKSPYLRTLFHFIPLSIYVVAFLISLFLFNGFEFGSVFNYMVYAAGLIFSDADLWSSLIPMTQELIAGKSVLLFAVVLCMAWLFLISLGHLLSMSMIGGGFTKSKIEKGLGFVLLLVLLWIIFWEFLPFLFSFFPLAKSLIYFLNLFAGIIFSGIVFYGLTLIAVGVFGKRAA